MLTMIRRTAILFSLLLISASAFSDEVPKAAEKKKEIQKAETKHTETENQNSVKSFPVVINVTGNSQNADNTCKSQECSHEPESWLEKFWSDPIATFTGGLFVVTALLVLVTGGLVWLGFRQEKMSRAHERAYVHAGGDFKVPVPDITGRHVGFHPHFFRGDIGNYGKTPAFVSYICVKVGTLSDGKPPIDPDYSGAIYFGLNLRPDGVLVPSRVSLTKEGVKNPFVYGRCWYKDIFDKWHSDGFIYAITGDNSTIAMRNAPSAYIKSDIFLDKDKCVG